MVAEADVVAVVGIFRDTAPVCAVPQLVPAALQTVSDATPADCAAPTWVKAAPEAEKYRPSVAKQNVDRLVVTVQVVCAPVAY